MSVIGYLIFGLASKNLLFWTRFVKEKRICVLRGATVVSFTVQVVKNTFKQFKYVDIVTEVVLYPTKSVKLANPIRVFIAMRKNPQNT